MMVILKRNEPGVMIVTASEKATLNPTVFNISFVNDITKKTILIEGATDISDHPVRYNKFAIDVVLFDGADNGFWTYQITDQDDNQLEVGKMKLEGEKISPVQYNGASIEYKTYGE